MTAIIGFILPTLVVYALLTRPLSTGPSPISRALGAGLAPGLGLGLASCSYLAFLVTASRHSSAARLDGAFWGLALAVVCGDRLFRTRRLPNGKVLVGGSGSHRSMRAPLMAAAFAFLVVAALVVAALALRVTILPHGEWDAWAIWNLRARALWRGAPAWSAIFSGEIGWSHPDYPVLIPVSVARLWAYAGRESTWVPELVASAFFGASIATVVVSVGELRGWTAGFLSGAVLLVPRTYVLQSSCQCADVPLAFFILVAVSMAAVARQIHGDTPHRLVISGLAAGLGAWTKNEGVVLLAIIPLLITTAPVSGTLRRWKFLALGAAVPLIAFVFFKLCLTQSANYLLEPQAIAGIRGRLSDGARWSGVIHRVLSTIVQWGEVPGSGLAVATVVVALTARLDRTSVSRGVSALAAIAALLAAYLSAYVITPLPLEWQIGTSLSRLLAQLWPTLVWGLFQLSGVQPRARDAGPNISSHRSPSAGVVVQ